MTVRITPAMMARAIITSSRVNPEAPAKLLRGRSAVLPLARKLNVPMGTPRSLACLRRASLPPHNVLQDPRPSQMHLLIPLEDLDPSPLGYGGYGKVVVLCAFQVD